ncbi:hypothetical protein ACNKF0_21735 [Nocardioides sp. T5]|uniref:hypothetical protein n=1 Tax=Nocardioides sp. T5 TaxID=3400182 RepID=UPI003A85541C
MSHRRDDLPWLVRLDKLIDGSSISGWSEFIVRSDSSETALKEAVALELLAEAEGIRRRAAP